MLCWKYFSVLLRIFLCFVDNISLFFVENISVFCLEYFCVLLRIFLCGQRGIVKMLLKGDVVRRGEPGY